MKRFIILTLTILFLCIVSLNVNASERVKKSSITNHVDLLKIGLKKVSGKTITLTTKGRYTLNNKNINSGNKLVFTIRGGKVEYNGMLYDLVEIEAKEENSRILINYGKNNHIFTGDFEIRNINGELIPINKVSIEDYVQGVLPYEMSSTYPLEALKAQAVSARNYAISSIDKHKNHKFDLCDGIHCQVYKGQIESSEKIEKAVSETKGQILTFNNEVVKAFFYASNGGYTESSQNVWKSDYSYLVSRKDEFDTYTWDKETVYTSKEIERILKKKGYIPYNDSFKKIGLVTTNSSGRNSNVEIFYKNSKGEEKVKNLIGEEPRTVFSLKSSMFDINYIKDRDSYIFEGKGFGHGVGMSQYGARKRAENGHSYKDILNFYYPKTKLESVN